MTDHGEYTVVYRAYGYLAGEMVRLLLEANDISVVAIQESAGATLGLTVGPLGEVQIMVPVSQAAEARNIIQAMDEGNLAKSFYPGRMTGTAVYKNNKAGYDEAIKRRQ